MIQENLRFIGLNLQVNDIDTKFVNKICTLINNKDDQEMRGRVYCKVIIITLL